MLSNRTEKGSGDYHWKRSSLTSVPGLAELAAGPAGRGHWTEAEPRTGLSARLARPRWCRCSAGGGRAPAVPT